MRLVNTLPLILLSLCTFLSGVNFALAGNPKSLFFRSIDSSFPSGSELTERLAAQPVYGPLAPPVSTRWVKALNFQTTANEKNIGWIHREDLLCDVDFEPNISIPAFAFSKRDSVLRQAPNSKSNELATLVVGDRPRILGMVGEWFKIETAGLKKIGYVPARDFLTRFDFSSSVRLKNEKQDQLVTKTLPGKIVLHDGRQKNWSDVESYRTEKMRCFSKGPRTSIHAEANEHSALVSQLVAFSPVKKIQEIKVRWNQARLAKHGLVWWSSTESPGSGAGGSMALPTNTITTQSLFKRKVSQFLRYEYPGSSLYVVSAGGLYKSNDGHVWHPIPGFGEQDYPITITKGGWVIAGPYLSRDKAETFEPFVKWERILNLVARLGWPSPKHVGITSVNLNNSTLFLALDLGKQRGMTIATQDWGNSWSVASVREPDMRPSSISAPDLSTPLDLPRSSPKWKWVSKPATSLTGL